MEPTTPPETPQPVRLTAAFHDLLSRPTAILERAAGTGAQASLSLLAGSVLLWALYGAAAGFFQGGPQILVAALKAPLIILLTLLLCSPSLFVFSAMAGTRWTARTFLAVLAGFAGTLGMVLLALLPVSWLFSASSRHLATAMVFQFLLWLVALALARKFLRQALEALGSRLAALTLWLGLFCLVSLQVTTMLRPVLLEKARRSGLPDRQEVVSRADVRRLRSGRNRATAETVSAGAEACTEARRGLDALRACSGSLAGTGHSKLCRKAARDAAAEALSASGGSFVDLRELPGSKTWRIVWRLIRSTLIRLALFLDAVPFATADTKAANLSLSL